MRHSLLTVSVLLALLGSGFGSVSAQTPSPVPAKVTLPPLTPDYKLVWSDEFSRDPDGLPDPAKWVFERGFVRNLETQYYTRDRTENARIEHGRLIIEARKEPKPFTLSDNINEAYGKKWNNTDIKPANFTSASITTYGKASWLYGRIEIRAKMPNGNTVWPALWTLGTNITEIGWPRCGEIDLVEMLGTRPHIVSGNFHYANDAGKHVVSDGGSLTVPTSDTDFHIYTLEWTADRINLYADGIRYSTIDVTKANALGQNPYRKPQYLIMNLALEGNRFEHSTFPQEMVVDYVRVYQKPSL
jgi:beta-glucanase (GH16 family)